MKLKTSKEILEELETREKLKARGYKWIWCKYCDGQSLDGFSCFHCYGRGGKWIAPITK